MKNYLNKLKTKFTKHNYKMYIIITAFFGLVAFIAVIIIILNSEKTNVLNDTSTLPGADKINPAVMYNDTIYYWNHLAGPADKVPQGELPKGYQYVGDIEYVNIGELAKNFQFIAAFKAFGQLYFNSNDPNNICICITTDWMKNSYVIFSSQ